MKQIKQWLAAGAIALTTLAVTAPGAQAAVIQVDFKYTGATTLNMTGSFKYDDSLIGTDNLVQKDDLLAFSYDVFIKGSTVSGFHSDLATIKAPGGFFSTFNFNYDAATTKFLFAAGKNSWRANSASSGYGMAKESTLRLGSSMTDGVLFTSPSPFTYTVTAVPEPETYGLMLLGLSLVGAAARRRKQA